jgi:hypothetical protein
MKNMGLEFQQSSSKLYLPIAYSDADWAGDLNDRKSTSGYVVMMNGAAVTWCSKKQTVVAKSTAEAEYIAASDCVTEALWFCHMLEEMDISDSEPTLVHINNNAAIQMTEKDVHLS